MARVWLKLEAIQAIQHCQQHYLKHLEQLMTWYPASERLRDLYEGHRILEQDMLKLKSIVDCRIYVGKNLVEFASNPLESDERFQMENELKNGKHPLFLALRQFRAEPEFKILNESIEDPSSAEAKELRKKNQDLEAKIEELKQTVSQERGDQQHSLRQLNALCDERDALQASIQRLDALVLELNNTVHHAQEQNVALHTLNRRHAYNLDINEETIGFLREEKEFLTNTLQTAEQEKHEAVHARLEAENAKDHALANHASIRKAFEQSDGRVSELNKQISDLTKAKDYWREEHRKINEKFLNSNARADQLQHRAANNYPRNGITANFPTTNTSARSVSAGSPIPTVSSEKALQKLFAEVAGSPPIPGTSTSSGNTINRNPTRVTSGSGSQVRQRSPSLTVVQTRVTKCMARMTDMQLESLEPAMKELEALHPGEHYHWVRGHWARDPNTKAFETTQDLERKKNSHSKLH